MNQSGPADLLGIHERLTRLETFLATVRDAAVQSQAQTAGILQKLLELERQQLRAERDAVTVAEVAALGERVERLAAAEARRQGMATQTAAAVPLIAQWAAVLIAGAALAVSVADRAQWANPTGTGRPAAVR